MLCCAIAVIGLAAAWLSHRLRLIGGLALLAAAAVAGGALLWDHKSHRTVTFDAERAGTDRVSLCSGRRVTPRPYPLL